MKTRRSERLENENENKSEFSKEEILEMETKVREDKELSIKECTKMLSRLNKYLIHIDIRR